MTSLDNRALNVTLSVDLQSLLDRVCAGDYAPELDLINAIRKVKSYVEADENE